MSIKLACPVCHYDFYDHLTYRFCHDFRDQLGQAIPDLVPAEFDRDPRYAFEMNRYAIIAERSQADYAGYAKTNPGFRAQFLADWLRAHWVDEYVDVGPGFGLLQDATHHIDRWALDYCLDFLWLIKNRLPEVHCIRAVAERLPLATGCVPCLVCESTFQTLVDRETFLCEAARVCSPGGQLVLTVGYKVNYPRRPQGGFDVRDRDQRAVLFRFLEELGFDVNPMILDTKKERWLGINDFDQGDYLYIFGTRR